MSTHIHENDIDYQEITYKVHPDKVESALANVEVALAELGDLKSTDSQVRSNEVYRALALVRDSLAGCLTPEAEREDY
jgi:hypothetical protein